MTIASLQNTITAGRYTEFDVDTGTQHWMLRCMGAPVADEHPFVDEILGAGVSFSEMVSIYGDQSVQNKNDVTSRTVELGLSTPYLRNVLTDAVQQYARTRTNRILADVRRIALGVGAPNYRPSGLPFIDVSDFDIDEQDTDENKEAKDFAFRVAPVTGENFQIRKSFTNLVITREMVLADDFGTVAAVLNAISQAAGRTVGKHLARLLTDNGELKDGAPWFGAQNTAATAGFDLVALGEAYRMLTQVPAIASDASALEGEDSILGVSPAFLLVPGSHAVQAYALAASLAAASETPPLSVIVNPWLDGGNYFYLLPAPEQAPAVAMATLSGGDDPLSIYPLPKGNDAEFDYDGLGYRVRLEYDLIPASRAIVRGTLS